MLSRIFGKKNKPQPSSRKPSGLIAGKENVRNNQQIMQDAQRETYQFDKPTQELGTTDLIKNHKSGERFLYAAVTANQAEEDSSRLRRLIQFQPRLSRKSIPVDKLPPISLYKEVESFDLHAIFPPNKNSSRKTYINISDVTVVYGSLISSDSIFSKVKVSIFDDRLLQNKIAKSYIANTNVISKASMSLSYCFPRDEVDAIKLTISREAAFLEEGRQWGVVQVQLQVEETEFPIQTSNVTVQAINALPQSMLEDRQVDPDLIDISITNNNRKELADLFMDGDLADESAPIVNKTEAVKYAKSSLAGPKGRKPIEQANKEWDFMNSRNKGVAAGANSISIQDEGSIKSDDSRARLQRDLEQLRQDEEISPVAPPTPPLKSALKRPRFASMDSVTDSERGSMSSESRRITVNDPSPLSEYLK